VHQGFVMMVTPGILATSVIRVAEADVAITRRIARVIITVYVRLQDVIPQPIAEAVRLIVLGV